MIPRLQAATPWLRDVLVAGNRFGENTLMWAAANGHLPVVSFLWEACYANAFVDLPPADQLKELGRKNHRRYL